MANIRKTGKKDVGFIGTDKAEPQDAPSSLSPKSFSIVGIGASAGGLEALQSFLVEMPADSGMAFVIVVHLSPGGSSMLPELLGAKTAMTVQQVTDGVRVLPNVVYVIPTDKSLSIRNGVLRLSDVHVKRAGNFPIDCFFRSLALDQGANAVGVILSGIGTDGTQGLNAIRENLGWVVVQNPDSAKFDGMPKSAIEAGLADFVLSPQEIPSVLSEFAQRSVASAARPSAALEIDGKSLQAIFVLLRSRTGHDFSQYKKNTILRRIERRMSMRQITEAADYVKYLHGNAQEPELLFKDLMIGVTSFFRDPEAFEILQSRGLSKLMADRPDGETIRVWVPGCSTGEEAYSLAILLHETMEKAGHYFPIQMFATDIDEEAISSARMGIYPESIQIALGKDRVNRYFDLTDSGYRISPMIREMLIFAPQSVIRDPPFTRLDLISCRNLFIYLNSAVQKRLLPLFHYSLKLNGLLFLGSSETIGTSNDLFSTVSKKGKVFARRPFATGLRPTVEFPLGGGVSPRTTVPIAKKVKNQMEELQFIETVLEESGASPCVIIDDKYNVLYAHGRTSMFLEPLEGAGSVNLLELARDGIRTELASAVQQVSVKKQEVVLQGLRVSIDSEEYCLDLTVRPVRNVAKAAGMMVVFFNEISSSPAEEAVAPKPVSRGSSHDMQALQVELQKTKEYLQATIEELETSNEEHRSTNEELQSTNEELQSTNEELETSKEELQSLNEESATVNAELQARVDELTKSNDDIKNLLDSTSLATVFLDLNLNICRFTPVAKRVIPLTTPDIGRPLGDLTTSLIDADLTNLATQVLDDLMTRECVLHSSDGVVYRVQARPYRTIANVIDGIVITFEDITERKRAEDQLRESEERFRMLFELANDSIVLIDLETLGIVQYNRRTYATLGYKQEEFSTIHISDIDAVQTNEELARRARRIAEKGPESFNTKHRKKNGETIDVCVKAQHISLGGRDYLLSTWQDLSEST